MLHFKVITAGKLDDDIQSLIGEYIKRLSPYAKINWRVCRTDTKESENSFFLSEINNKPFIALDETGIEITSIQIAKCIEGKANAGHSELIFVIGGSYGLSDEIKHKAESIWSFGKITLPHQLARLILIEQLYRAISINFGGKYHH